MNTYANTRYEISVPGNIGLQDFFPLRLIPLIRYNSLKYYIIFPLCAHRLLAILIVS